jgi:hypothetical protein
MAVKPPLRSNGQRTDNHVHARDPHRRSAKTVTFVKDRSEMASAARDLQASRKGPRKRVLMRGTLFTPDGAFVIWIRDISANGALVSSKDRLPVDSDVIFKRGTVFAAAHIAWSNETGAGVTFYRDLTNEDLASAALPLPSHD